MLQTNLLGRKVELADGDKGEIVAVYLSSSDSLFRFVVLCKDGQMIQCSIEDDVTIMRE